MGGVSWSSPPYGPLNPIHDYIISNALPISSQNWHYVLLVPFLPIGVQCLLLFYPHTRPYRIALGVAGVAIMARAWASYRFVAFEYNAFNCGIGIAFLHLSAKYVEFACYEGPIVDPYVAKGRWTLMAAIDLAINSRMVGLGMGRYEQGTAATSARSLKGNQTTANGVRHNGNPAAMDTHPVPATSEKERWLSYARVRRTRSQAVARHLAKGVMHYLIFDTDLALLRRYAGDTIASAKGAYPGATRHLVHTTSFTFLPQLYPTEVSVLAKTVMAEICLALGVWQGISWGYHTFAVIGVGSRLWETESWEVDMFDQPLKADSLMDLWGRRWHSMFRHHFLLLGNLVLGWVKLPPNSPLLLPLIFFFSGCLHALGELSMHPVPAPLPIACFFFLSALGTAFELAFKKATGRRVGGWAGRIWAWVWMLATARMAVEAWLDAGLGGSHMTPVELGGWRTPGEHIAGWIGRWVVDRSHP